MSIFYNFIVFYRKLDVLTLIHFRYDLWLITEKQVLAYTTFVY